jgi:DNA-binding NtrC family response regulator
MKTIMVIDDETNILEKVKTCLEEENIEVVAVDNNRKAFELLEENNEDNFSLILIDSSLPDSNTPAFFSMKPNIKRNIDTSNEEDFLQKPFTKQQLIDFIKKKIQ